MSTAQMLYVGEPEEVEAQDLEGGCSEGETDVSEQQRATTAKTRFSRLFVGLGAATLVLTAAALGWYRRGSANEVSAPAEAETLFDAGMATPMSIFHSVTHGHEYFTPGFYHGPHHLIHDSMLYKEPTATSEILGVKEKGTQLFPLKIRGDWVQVIVPKEQHDRIHSTFGWMYMRNNDMDMLLERDAKLAFKRAVRKPRTQADLERTWAEARAKNAVLKKQLSKLEGMMKKSRSKVMDAVNDPAIALGEKDVDVRKVHDEVANLSKSLRAEFAKDPNLMLKDFVNVMK